MGMLEMSLLWAPAMGDLIQRNLDHFCCSVVDPRNTAVIESDMSVGYCGHAGIFYLMINKAELVTRLWWMRRLIRTCGLKTVTIH